MAKYCGGITIDKKTMKIINGVICDIGATIEERRIQRFYCGGETVIDDNDIARLAELMETLQVINPRLYAGVIKKLKA